MEASAEKSVANANVLVLLSGGIDSTACVAYYVSLGYDVCALFIDYGQPEAKLEQAAAIAIAKHYDLTLKQLAVFGYKAPEGYVPARNAMLLSAALMSFDYEYGIISLGIHAGTPYADCSPYFEQAMQRVFDVYSQGRVRINAPFLHWTKGEIWDYAQMTGVPLFLTKSNNLSSLHPKVDS